MELLFELVAKSGPFFQPVIAVLLVLLWRSHEGDRTAAQQIAEAQNEQAAAMRDQAEAVKALVAVGNLLVRMQERLQTAATERHAANVDKLNTILSTQRRGRSE